MPFCRISKEMEEISYWYLLEYHMSYNPYTNPLAFLIHVTDKKFRKLITRESVQYTENHIPRKDEVTGPGLKVRSDRFQDPNICSLSSLRCFYLQMEQWRFLSHSHSSINHTLANVWHCYLLEELLGLYYFRVTSIKKHHRSYLVGVSSTPSFLPPLRVLLMRQGNCRSKIPSSQPWEGAKRR